MNKMLNKTNKQKKDNRPITACSGVAFPMSNLYKKKKIKLVIAGDYQQFKLWFEYHKRLKGYEDCRYISSPEKLYGYRQEQVEIVLVGEYWRNPAHNSLRFQLLTDDLIVVKPK